MYKKIAKTLAICFLTVASMAFTISPTAFADAPAGQTTTLYERLGGWDGINQVVRDTIARHHDNPAISHFFENVDDEQLAAHVTAFFAAGTGGPSKYEGRDMTSAHAGMKMSDADFDSAVADVLSAVDQNGVGAVEKSEVAAILESLRPAVMGTAGT
ncbi:MAG: group 1 truncated hemoglobin [Gammaproteobacteria bacterium]|nr:group 1 truncated hemoglobin [Gammaproteobacteria bacterium]MDH3430448.1 group 1 truncated hemoglobin [Gammaproteobacteria bacterium]MDH3434856.1 group 1 truncated hemoglobin [Gammaproteobacteria bacterium]